MARPFDLIFAGGLILDGSGEAEYTGDLAIAGGRIAAVGSLDHHDAEKVVPVHGMAVSPGFIDSHGHSDFTLLADPRAEGKISQGITTEISGNCGMSAAPLEAMVRERREPDLRELGIRDRWQTLEEYFRLLESAGPALNVAILAGHNNIRGAVIGYENRTPSPGEVSEMGRMLRAALAHGAIGLSSGLIYPPGTYCDTEELVQLCSLLSGDRHIYASHMRSEGEFLDEAVQEVLTIGERSGVRVHISHVKTSGEENWHKAESVISRIETARARGIRVSCDCYPYTSSSTDLDSLLPSWTYEGGNEEELSRIRNPETRARIRSGMQAKSGRPGYWDKVVVSSVATAANSWMEGKTIREISEKLECDGIEAVFRILEQEELRAGAIFRSMSRENKKKFLSLPFCTIGSDSSARSFDGATRRGKPHPRTFGTFPRFLRRYVYEQGIMGLAEAIRRVTFLPATTFGLHQRGLLKEGMHADVVVFDPDRIRDTATYDSPFQQAEGIRFVLVNGVCALDEGRLTGVRAGSVLRGVA